MEAVFPLASIVFGLVFGAGGVWVLGKLFGDLRHGQASAGWPRVPGKVLTSEVYLPRYEQQRDEDLTTTSHKLRLEYEYTVQGEAYRSKKVSFAIRPLTPGRMDDIIARYPAGTEVTVHHEPDRPGIAVLEAGDEHTSKVVLVVALVVGLSFVAIGLAAAASGVLGLMAAG